MLCMRDGDGSHNLGNTYVVNMQLRKSMYGERLWRSGNVMNCHATAPGSIPGRDGVFTELHVLRKGQ